MDERDLEIFHVLMETKNITAASQSLYMTQSAVTKRLHKLEQELGAPLFVRTVKGLIPTASAESIANDMGQLQESLQRVKSLAQFAHGHVAGHLRIGTSVNFARYKLPALLKAYITTCPDVQITVITGQSTGLYQKLQQGELLLAILRGHFSSPLEGFQLTNEKVYAVTRKENAKISFNDLPYIHRQSDKPFTAQVQRWKSEQHLRPAASSIQVNDIAACLSMIRHGIGWSILPEICLENKEGLLLKPLQFNDGSAFVRSTYVFYQNDYAKLPQVRLFLDMLQKS